VKIERVDVFPVAVPLARPLKLAVATVHERTCIVVRIVTDEGIEGLGEAVVALYFSGESLASSTHLIRDVFAPILVERNAGDLYELQRSMRRIAIHNNGARAAVEMALVDIVARSAGAASRPFPGRARCWRSPTWTASTR
jgi:muconate cycloisomerase